MNALSRSSRLRVLVFIFSCTHAFSSLPGAESWQSVQQYSKIEPAPPEALAGGDIKAQKINLDGLPDGLCVESLYLLPLPPDQVLKQLRKKLCPAKRTPSRKSKHTDDLKDTNRTGSKSLNTDHGTMVGTKP